MKYLASLLTLLLIFSPFSASQSQFEDYTEQIPGTDLTIAMLALEGGSFQMGSNHSEDEQPTHEVTVSSFWMAKHETTWNLFRLYMERNIDAEQPQQVAGTEVKIKVDAISGATTPYVDMSFGMGTDGYPATGMTQLSASRFCEWLSAMTGNFYRLPTEAEWEYAAKAGTNTAYSFGNESSDLEQYGWSKRNSNEAYQLVGSKQANPWGLHDMHGNVAEWTLDKFAPYSSEDSTDPFVVPDKTYPRVVRGGSWKDEPDALRSSARMASNKSWKKRDPQIPKSKWWHTDAPFVGFRVVRPLKTPSAEEQKQYWGY
ncbi:formylglycine-generating enzyme family protein [Roseivirga pacifica]|uniref:formylglycine-generating enzyme family protein n=1 Tax=Roseivirga pacifica TaxID=1267423 RepID=UPI003BB0C109